MSDKVTTTFTVNQIGSPQEVDDNAALYVVTRENQNRIRYNTSYRPALEDGDDNFRPQLDVDPIGQLRNSYEEVLAEFVKANHQTFLDQYLRAEGDSINNDWKNATNEQRANAEAALNA